MLTDNYIDPPNTPELLEKIMNLPTIGDIKKLADEIFPGWFVTTMNAYCSDYPHLTKNWETICNMSRVRPTQIMIVDDCVVDDAHRLISVFSECFTRAGFSVRRKIEYNPCEKCGSAVPVELLWDVFRHKNFNVPSVWNKLCTCCQPI